MSTSQNQAHCGRSWPFGVPIQDEDSSTQSIKRQLKNKWSVTRNIKSFLSEMKKLSCRIEEARTSAAPQVLAAYMQGCGLFTPAVTIGFGLSQLETVLKAAMQAAGVEGQPSVLLIEDHHVTSDDILETINSLLSAGEGGLKQCSRLMPATFETRSLCKMNHYSCLCHSRQPLPQVLQPDKIIQGRVNIPSSGRWLFLTINAMYSS